MVSWLLFLLLRPTGGELGPVLPPGLNREFSTSVLTVENFLAKSDFSGATKAAARLPAQSVIVNWDSSKIPPSQRAPYAKQRDMAFQEWQNALKIKIVVSNAKPNVFFTFAPLLENSPRMGLPLGLSNRWSIDPTQPRLRSTIGLQRGNPAVGIGQADIHNAVSQAIGSYLGIATSPIEGTLMGGTELSYPQSFLISDSDIQLATKALKIADELRANARNRKQITPAKPVAIVDRTALELGNTTQGAPKSFSVHISNTGNAPLSLLFVPDCGCVVTDRTALVKAGGSYDLQGNYDTTLKFGDIHHYLRVRTNDLENPDVQIPVHINIQPKYRLIIPDGDTIGLTAEGATLTAYLLTPTDCKTHIDSATIGGLKGDTTIAPWSGSIADTEMGEAARDRVGYKIVARLSGKSATKGRVPATLVVRTDDPQFMTLVRSFYAQQGIAATPSEIYMGEVGHSPLNYSLFVTGVGGNFHVKKVTCPWPHLAVQLFVVREGAEYRIQASYDGQAPSGSISTQLVVETDDPTQPVITIPISGRAG